MHSDVVAKYEYRQMPTLNVLHTLTSVEVPFRGTSDMHFNKIHNARTEKNPPLQNYNAGKDPQITCR